MDPSMTSVAVDRIQDLAAAVLRLRTVAAHGHCQSDSGARQLRRLVSGGYLL